MYAMLVTSGTWAQALARCKCAGCMCVCMSIWSSPVVSMPDRQTNGQRQRDRQTDRQGNGHKLPTKTRAIGRIARKQNWPPVDTSHQIACCRGATCCWTWPAAKNSPRKFARPTERLTDITSYQLKRLTKSPAADEQHATGLGQQPKTPHENLRDRQTKRQTELATG